MLKLHIIVVGRDKESWVAEQTNHYRKILRRYARLDMTVIPEARYTQKGDKNRAIESEAESIERHLKGGYLFALDTKGRAYTTYEFADRIENLKNDGKTSIEFVIGGPFGLSEAFKKSAQANGEMISLSPLTMSHQIVRLVLLEQLFRVLNLKAGGSYHK